MKDFIRFAFASLLLVSLLCPLKGQSPEQIVRQVETNRSEFYYGHGYADDYDQAVQKAKAQLLQDISAYVKVDLFGSVSTENGVSMEERIRTYTNMTQLRDVTTVAVTTEPDNFHVFCYLTRTAVQRMFEERKQKMLNYFEEGRRAENKLKLTDALQSYYWASLILRTLPDDNQIQFTDVDGQQQNLQKWLNIRIRHIVDEVKFEVADVTVEDDWNVVDVKVTYEGKPVANCDYKYWTGLSYSPITRAKNGHGVAEFKEVPKSINFFVEYAFETEAQNLDAELRDIVQGTDKPAYKNTHTAALPTLPFSAVPQSAVLQEPELPCATGSVYYSEMSSARRDSCMDVMKQVQSAVRSKNTASVQFLFTDEGFAMFDQMMKNGNAILTRTPQLSFVQTQDDIICRSLPMSFKFPRSGKTILENVTFRLDNKTLKIKSLSFGLGQDAQNDIMDTAKKWDDRSRAALVRFLEDYQTAYSLKRADFLESIFSDDALIIVGTKLKAAPNIDNCIRLNDKDLYQYTRSTKEQYIRALRRVFASAEFVNLQLKDNEIVKSAGQEIYGIQVRQLYASNSYADQGYLFLIVDLRNADNPVIHVRTWQPDKDPNFGLFDMSKFSGL